MKQHPKWLDTACFYEIYPQSFQDSNEDGIGDIPGIIQRLDYIHELGFDALWINPVYLSPFFDAGYDVTDFKKVAPRYGTNQDLYRLFAQAHKRGMHVLLDLVPGHTATDCPWFIKSCKAKKNEYTDRYIWTKDVWTSPKDLNVLRGISERDGAVVTNFFSIQPALNYGFNEPSESYEQAITDEGPQSTIHTMIDIIKFWLSHGCDGFRCDMAGWLVKHDPEQEGTIKVWQQIINDVKQEYPESAFVSEWNNPANSLRAGFDMDFLLQDEFNPYNSQLARIEKPYFQFNEEKKDAKLFFEHFQEVYQCSQENNKFLSIISGNHDTKRIASFLNEEELKFYYTFMFTSPNVPFLYYGDEIGMKFEENLTSVEGGYKRTGSRSPMQWDKNKKAGFSNANKLYIPVNPDRNGISVEEETNNPDSLLEYIRTLLSFKHAHVSLDNDADFELVKTNGYSPLVYIRKKYTEKLLIAINPSCKNYSISYEAEFKGNSLLSIGEATILKEKSKIKLSPNSLIIIE
jgi:glycosidase